MEERGHAHLAQPVEHVTIEFKPYVGCRAYLISEKEKKETRRKQGRTFSRTFRRSKTLPHPDFRLLLSRTVRK